MDSGSGSHGGWVERLQWGLVVTSDRVYRGEAEDKVTPLVLEALEAAGHSVVYRAVAPNSAVEIQYHVLAAIRAGADVVLVTGGTGPRPADLAVDAVRPLASRELPGIGELFRRLSEGEVGRRAYLSRATAFIVHGRLVAVSPGSPGAVRTMLEEVLLPLAGHIVYELRR